MRKKALTFAAVLTAGAMLAACGGSSTQTTAAAPAATEAPATTAAPAETEAPAETKAEETKAEETRAEEKKEEVKKGEAADLETYLMENTEAKDNNRAFKVSNARSNATPMTGYYTYSFENGRTFKIYIPEYSALRSYVYAIAVPDGTDDVYAFLEEKGWIAQADKYGETLLVLEPKDGKWGAEADEQEYLNLCLGETVGNTAGDTREKAAGGVIQSGKVTLSDGTTVGFFAGHSCNYYVGYGEGAAPLEAWTAMNPMYVISQAFVGGKAWDESLETALMDAVVREYNGINNGSYGYGLPDVEFQKILDGLQEDGTIDAANFVTNGDIPVPTLFAGYAEDEGQIGYWKAVNETSDTAEDGVYYQDLKSTAWQTQYMNAYAEEQGSDHGISAVKVVEDAEVPAEEIRGFLAQYTRYTNPFAYSNTLALRTDFYEITQAAREEEAAGTTAETYKYMKADGTEGEVEVRAMQSGTITAPISGDKGTFYSLVTAFNDYDGDGKNDPRESLMYVPESAKKAEGKTPLVVVFPGMTQSMSTFMDCSGWWSIANREGIAFIIIGEYTKASATTLIYGDFDDCSLFDRSDIALMEEVIAPKEGIEIDASRIYAAGHSFGSYVGQTLTHNADNDIFAAVASTSFPNSEFTEGTKMPSYLMIGQADISELNADSIVGDLLPEGWEVSDSEVIFGVNRWITNMASYNGIDITFEANDHDSFVKTCTDCVETGRYHTYTWADENGAPVIRFGRTMLREHNCIPQEFLLAWDYVKNFKNEDGVRSYSESAFAEDDAVEILK